MRIRIFCAIAVLGLSTGACARQEVIPEQLLGKVNRDLDFAAVQHNPEVYRGNLILVGGEVLSARRLEDGTRIEILHRPLSSDLMPRGDLESQGRLVAIDRGRKGIDPALLEDRALVTIVGEVVGSDSVSIDRISEDVPKLRVKHVTLWKWQAGKPEIGHQVPLPSEAGGYLDLWGLGGYYPYPQTQEDGPAMETKSLEGT